MARKKSVSYSQFALWEQCPYSWKLQYVDKALPFTDNIYTLFGTSMHEVLQEYLKVMYSKSIKEADKLILDEELEDRMKNKGMNVDAFGYHLNVFDFGVPPHAGCGIGLERLMMALTGTENIRDTTFYPRDVDRLTP